MFIPKHLLGIALLLCLPLNGCEKGEEPTTATSENVKAPKPETQIKATAKKTPVEAVANQEEDKRSIVIGSELSVDSKVLGQARNISVILPMNYEKGSKRYPVLYLIDGGVQQDLIPVAGFGALATLSGQYREFIIVGIETVNRKLELTTPSIMPYDLLQIPQNGGADDFRRFILEEVKPIIGDRYRTTEETAVLGESLAGFFIVDTFLRMPTSFTHYIAVSPSLWWKGKALATSSARYLSGASFPGGRSLYLASADEVDIIEAIKPLHRALQDKAPQRLKWWYQPMPTEHHNTVYHPATLNALRLIFAKEEKH